DHTDTDLLSVTALTNSVPYTNSILATNAIDYYQYNVSQAAVGVTFDLFPQDGDVNLLVRKALPGPTPLPTTSVFDYSSANPGLAPDEVIVTTNSVPVSLTPGIWYLGVYNSGTNKVNYKIVATETSKGITIIPLTNAVPYNTSAPLGVVPDKYFKFTVG